MQARRVVSLARNSAMGLLQRGLRTGRGTALRKSLGQHLLVDRASLRGIVDAAGILPTEHVLEVGPGTGNLTVLLLERAAAVTAIEMDDDLHALLLQRVERLGMQERLQAVRGDALVEPFPPADAVVANVPYQISSPLLQRLFSLPAGLQPTRSVLLLQSEFVDRMVAQPGSPNYSRLSVACALFADVTRALDVPRLHFRPPPKVDSAVAVVRHRPDRAEAAGVSFAAFSNLLRFCFESRNKTLRSHFLKKSAARRLLARRTAVDEVTSGRVHATSGRRSVFTEEQVATEREQVDALLAESDLLMARPNAMPLDDFLRLFKAMEAAGYDWTRQ